MCRFSSTSLSHAWNAFSHHFLSNPVFLESASWLSLIITSLRWSFFCLPLLSCKIEHDLRVLYVSCTYFFYNKTLKYYMCLFSYLISLQAYKTSLRSRKSSLKVLKPQHLAQCLTPRGTYRCLLNKQDWVLVCRINNLHDVKIRRGDR